jgi:hypothetical protein
MLVWWVTVVSWLALVVKSHGRSSVVQLEDLEVWQEEEKLNKAWQEGKKVEKLKGIKMTDVEDQVVDVEDLLADVEDHVADVADHMADVEDHVASVRDILYEDDWTAESNEIDTDGPLQKRLEV